MLREQGHRGEGKEEVRQEIRKEGRWDVGLGDLGASLVAQTVKNLPAMQDIWV